MWKSWGEAQSNQRRNEWENRYAFKDRIKSEKNENLTRKKPEGSTN